MGFWDKPPNWDRLAAWHPYFRAFILNAAPTAFKWASWCGILALLRYAELETSEQAFRTIRWILGILLWGYFTQLFSDPETEWLPKEEILKVSRWVWWLCSTAATVGMVWASFWLADVFMAHPL